MSQSPYPPSDSSPPVQMPMIEWPKVTWPKMKLPPFVTTVPVASVLFLLSALSILLGVWLVISPLYAHDAMADRPEEMVLEWFTCLISLSGYELALLGVLLFILAARKAYDDSVALVMLIAGFLIGSAVALDTVGPAFWMLAPALALSAALLAGVKLYALGRWVFGRLPISMWIALVILLIGNYTMPAVMGWANQRFAQPELTPYWLFGWCLCIVGALATIFAAASLPAGSLPIAAFHRPANTPLLRSPLMPWVFTGIVLVGCFVHQFAIMWAFNLLTLVGDMILAGPLLAVLAIELRRLRGATNETTNAAIAATPLPLAMAAILVGEYSFTLVETYGGFGLIAYPPAVLAAYGVALVGHGAARCNVAMLFVGLVAFLLASLTLGVGPDATPVEIIRHFNWPIAAAEVVMTLVALSAYHRRSTYALAAVVLTAGAAGYVADHVHLPAWALASLVFGLGTLCVAALWRDLSRLLTLVGAVIGQVGLLMCLDFGVSGWTPIAGLAAAMATTIVAWRRADIVLYTLAVVPLTAAIYVAMEGHFGWLLIMLSFVLLATGAIASITLTDPPASDGDPATPAVPGAPPANRSDHGSHRFAKPVTPVEAEAAHRPETPAEPTPPEDKTPPHEAPSDESPSAGAPPDEAGPTDAPDDAPPPKPLPDGP